MKRDNLYLYNSPVGNIEIETRDDQVISLHFSDENIINYSDEKDGVVKDVINQLERYFKGELVEFSLNLKIEGTDFQKKVWDALRKIPYGETRSYEDIARNIGNIKSVRAVGNANGKNRFPIIIPCHRVISKSGDIGGYSGGLWRKKYLLDLEKRYG